MSDFLNLSEKQIMNEVMFAGTPGDYYEPYSGIETDSTIVAWIDGFESWVPASAYLLKLIDVRPSELLSEKFEERPPSKIFEAEVIRTTLRDVTGRGDSAGIVQGVILPNGDIRIIDDNHS